MNKLLKLRDEVERLKEETGIGLSEHDNGVEQGRMEIINTMLFFIDDMLKEPVSEDLDDQRFAKEMDAIFALPSSETKNTEEEPLNWEYAIAKHFFELGLKEHQWNISDDLVEASRNYADNEEYGDDAYFAIKAAFDAGANWQKEHMMAKSVDAKVCNKAYPTKFEIETNTFIQKLNHGDNVKLIIINED